MVLLQATIPLVESTSYQRSWFVTAMAASPLFICAYLGNLSFRGFIYAVLAGGVLSCASWIGTHGSSGDEPPLWDVGTGFPIGAAAVALYGFAIAALWIDILASEIVGILHFYGVLAAVDPSVLGVTVLAWGNSLTDFIANTSMAGKSAGGTSMAMTACFAGPLFNILVGLGLGFWALFVDKKQSVAAVRFDPVVLVGCVFAMINCVGMATVAMLNKHWLPARYGWTMICWYGVYMTVLLFVVLF